MLRRTLTVGLALALSLLVPLRAADAPKIDKELEGDWEPRAPFSTAANDRSRRPMSVES